MSEEPIPRVLIKDPSTGKTICEVPCERGDEPINGECGMRGAL